MTIEKEYLKSINELSDYRNFAEEVVIISEAQTGKQNSIYSIKNKNGVTFHSVPGQRGLTDRGFLGFINNDRARPVLLTAAPNVSVTVSTVIGATSAGGSVAWQASDGLDLSIDITASVQWDIQLVASHAGNDDTETKTAYIQVN